MIILKMRKSLSRPGETELIVVNDRPVTGPIAEGCRSGKERRTSAFETALVSLISGWIMYGEAQRATYLSYISDDGVLGEYWEAIGHALLGLLNGELGMLDGGSLDRLIRSALRDGGCDPDR